MTHHATPSSFAFFILAAALVATVHGLATKPKKRYECVTEGRFPHPLDCGRYVDCIPGDAGFEPREGTCNGAAFHPSRRTCVPLEEMPGCKPRVGRTLAEDLNMAHVCENESSSFKCGDCKLMVKCVNGTAYPEPCSEGFMCTEENERFGGGVCHHQAPSTCQCDDPHEIKKDPYSNSKYLVCQNDTQEPRVYECMDDYTFNDTEKTCVNVYGLPACTKIGFFAKPSDCTTYYSCIQSKQGWVQKLFSCNEDAPTHDMFNEETQQCENPCEWPNTEFSCEDEGRYADPLDCHKYYECVMDLKRRRMDMRQVTCPAGSVWDNDEKVCKTEGTVKCMQVHAPKCSVPDNWCPAGPIVEPSPSIPTIKPSITTPKPTESTTEDISTNPAVSTKPATITSAITATSPVTSNETPSTRLN